MECGGDEEDAPWPESYPDEREVEAWGFAVAAHGVVSAPPWLGDVDDFEGQPFCEWACDACEEVDADHLADEFPVCLEASEDDPPEDQEEK